jgi:hypothetical protein
MTFWEWLDRRYPTERGWVTIATFVLAGSMLKMAEVHKDLWNVELFKTLLTLVIGTAIVNMILAFHFTANKGEEVRAGVDAKRAETSGKLADALVNATGVDPGAPPTNSLGDPAADAPTGKPGDPVHVVEETKPKGD